MHAQARIYVYACFSLDKDVKELTDEEEKLVARMEDIIKFFLNLLQVTGGDPAPEKCVLYLISHRWKNGIPFILPVHQSHRGIKITSRSMGIAYAIKRKSSDQGHRTLGFYLTGDGTSSAHKKIMLNKGVVYAEAITNSTLKLGKFSIAYGAYYTPSMDNGTPASYLTTNECENIQ
jgi:hypothetical protein